MNLPLLPNTKINLSILTIKVTTNKSLEKYGIRIEQFVTAMQGLTTVFARLICALFFYFGR
jgi:hypothetical protein